MKTTRWEIKPTFRNGYQIAVNMMTNGMIVPEKGEMFKYRGKWGCIPSSINLRHLRYKGVKNLVVIRG